MPRENIYIFRSQKGIFGSRVFFIDDPECCFMGVYALMRHISLENLIAKIKKARGRLTNENCQLDPLKIPQTEYNGASIL